jgi:hypothetical protein
MDDGMVAPARSIRDVRTSAIVAGPVTRRRSIVIALGAEGSGLSLCARVLNALGVDMTGGSTQPAAGQPLSNGAAEHWSRPEIADFHGRILALFQGGRQGSSDDLELPVSWWADPRVGEIRREMAAFVDVCSLTGRFGFQDPRAMRLMPVWNQVAKELRLAPKIIHCLRNPAQVAPALREYHGISEELGEYRWFAHTVEFFRHARKAEICTIEYDEWFVDEAANLSKLRSFLGLPDDRIGLEADQEVFAIVDEARSDRGLRSEEPRQPLIRSVYRLARRADRDPAARDQLRHIAGQLVSFQQLHAAAQKPFSDASAAGNPGKPRRTVPIDSRIPRYCISPASFWQPEQVVPSAWYQHAPFAFWLMDALRPEILVELGTHHGFSYLVFCQAVVRLGGMTKCYAVDTWAGDEHAGFYGEEVFATLNDLHEPRYSGFSRLVRSTFDEALPHFGDGTVDLLHIDGRHGYDDVVHDFESWLPKLSARGVVLLHDVNVRERGFGVWQFWQELQDRYPCFEFVHGHGLGVVQVGRVMHDALRPLFEGAARDKSAIAEMYAQLGRMAILPQELEQLRGELHKREAQRGLLETETAALRRALSDAETRARENAEARRNAETRARENAEAQARKNKLREEEFQRIRMQIAELRDAVEQAEREARERTAAEVAMRRDITDTVQGLKAELANARQVGRAALDALATSTVAPARELPLGWRQAIRRFFGSTRSR